MKKKMKLSLDELKVQSFVTSLAKEDEAVAGGETIVEQTCGLCSGEPTCLALCTAQGCGPSNGCGGASFYCSRYCTQGAGTVTLPDQCGTFVCTINCLPC